MPDIITLIPQKTPFVMIGELLHCDETTTRTTYHITEDNVMVDDNEFTEGGLMENIAQTAAARAGYLAQKENEPVAGGYIAAVKNFEVFNLPKVNDQLLTEITIQDRVFDMTIILGTVLCNDVLLAKCEMSIFTGNDA
jgi:predicted hotdog family 3-hydroxylacyl-ACP dehydratase